MKEAQDQEASDIQDLVENQEGGEEEAEEGAEADALEVTEKKVLHSDPVEFQKPDWRKDSTRKWRTIGGRIKTPSKTTLTHD